MVQDIRVAIQRPYPGRPDRRTGFDLPVQIGAWSSPRVCLAVQRVVKYRRHADRCRERAERTVSPAERELLLELARHWDAIADLQEQLGPAGDDS